jgi:AraC-like DNA-binding protein
LESDIVQKQLLYALRRKLIPWLSTQPSLRLLLAEPPIIAPPGVRILGQRPPLPPVPRAHSPYHGYMWPELRMQTVRYIGLSFILEGEADFLIGADPDNPPRRDGIQHNPKVEVLAVPERTLMALPAGVARTSGVWPHWERSGIENASSQILWVLTIPSGAFCHICKTQGRAHTSEGVLTIEDRQLEPIAQVIIEELRTRGDNYEAVVCSLTLGLLLRIERNLQSQLVISGRHITQMTLPLPEASPFVQGVCRFIHLHRNDPLTLPEIARQHHLSASQLNRRFHAEVGMSVIAYLNHCRIETAKRLLADADFTELTIQQVGDAVGITDTSYFRRVFKKSVGMTPLEFRERHLRAARQRQEET